MWEGGITILMGDKIWDSLYGHLVTIHFLVTIQSAHNLRPKVRHDSALFQYLTPQSYSELRHSPLSFDGVCTF